MLDPSANPTAPVHDHRRHVRVCPALFPPAIIPRRPWPRLLWTWSEALRFEETRAAFLATVGAESVTYGSPFDVTMRDGPDVRPCCCGTMIIYPGVEPLQAVVPAHNATPGHADWEALVGLPWLADAGART